MKHFRLAVFAVVVSTVALAPHAGAAAHTATATVHVTVTVLPSASISASQPVTTSAWTGASREALPFNVTVDSSDPAGYVFTITGTNAASGAFTLAGTGANPLRPTYTVTGPRAGETYADGVPGTTVYRGPTNDAVITFAVNLPVLKDVTPDTYTDTLRITVDVQ